MRENGISENGVKRLDDKGWEVLLRRIEDGTCTPILGPGVYSNGPSIRGKIAQDWAQKYQYPLADQCDLARVARFLSVDFSDAEYPATKYIEELKKFSPPDFSGPNEPYTILAKLPLPLYLTTNYDDFMEQALTRQHRDVKPDLCRWLKSLGDEPSPLANGVKPTVASPSVFHFYGYTQLRQSLVLTEDDYFQFLINVSRDQDLIPQHVQKAIANTSLVLLGFSLDDWDFRILFHLLAGYLKTGSKTHVAVQISPLSKETPEDIKQRAQSFFDKYFESRSPDLRVSWDTTEEFVAKLQDRRVTAGYVN